MNIFLAVVLFTGLPHPPSEENMTQMFVQDITVLSGKEIASCTNILYFFSRCVSGPNSTNPANLIGSGSGRNSPIRPALGGRNQKMFQVCLETF